MAAGLKRLPVSPAALIAAVLAILSLQLAGCGWPQEGYGGHAEYLFPIQEKFLRERTFNDDPYMEERITMYQHLKEHRRRIDFLLTQCAASYFPAKLDILDAKLSRASRDVTDGPISDARDDMMDLDRHITWLEDDIHRLTLRHGAPLRKPCPAVIPIPAPDKNERSGLKSS